MFGNGECVSLVTTAMRVLSLLPTAFDVIRRKKGLVVNVSFAVFAGIDVANMKVYATRGSGKNNSMDIFESYLRETTTI